jgi:hypothetical protein
MQQNYQAFRLAVILNRMITQQFNTPGSIISLRATARMAFGPRCGACCWSERSVHAHFLKKAAVESYLNSA